MDSTGSGSGIVRGIRRAFSEFLTIPALIAVGFLLLAAGTSALDEARFEWLQSIREAIVQLVFGTPEATTSLLGEVAGSLITVTSITFSLLLLAVQQSAAALSSQVFVQFLRRKLNQVFFGFFVGLALYSLLILSSIRPTFNPVIGATTSLLLAIVALCFLVLLIYTTINQARPDVIIKSIHDHTLRARERQLSLVRNTRRAPRLVGSSSSAVRATVNGFVTEIDLDTIRQAIDRSQGEVEIELLVSVGSYVAYQDTLALLRSATDRGDAAIEEAVNLGIKLDDVRDIDGDPVYGIEQLVNIAWRSISTSQQNVVPGILTTHALHDLLARWAAHERDGDLEGATTAPVVYKDNLMPELMGAFESLAVVSCESMQHQNYTEVVLALTTVFDRLAPEQQRQAEDVILRILSCLGDLVLTSKLDDSLKRLTDILNADGYRDTGEAVEAARAALAASVGELNSRSTRAQAAESSG